MNDQDSKSVPDDQTERLEETVSDWVDAPTGSHIKAFRFIDRRYSKTFAPSELQVTFRSTTNKRTGQIRPEVTYKYQSQDHIAIREVFIKMCAASSPGSVLDRELIKTGNPGSPV